jgi:hypothetical protein
MECLLNNSVTFQYLKCVPQKTFPACYEKAHTCVQRPDCCYLTCDVRYCNISNVHSLSFVPPPLFSLSLSLWGGGLSFSLTFCKSWSGLSLLSFLWCQRVPPNVRRIICVLLHLFTRLSHLILHYPNYMFFGRFFHKLYWKIHLLIAYTTHSFMFLMMCIFFLIFFLYL